MVRHGLSDDQWESIRPLLSASRPHRAGRQERPATRHGRHILWMKVHTGGSLRRDLAGGIRPLGNGVWTLQSLVVQRLAR